MEKITNFTVDKLNEESIYVKPVRMRYEQNNIKKIWDGIISHDSVAVLLYNRDKKSLVLVKQFRPVVYMNKFNKKKPEEELGGENGVTLELCAGIIDKQKPIEEIAVEEVWEECGYRTDPGSLEKITTCAANVGLLGTTMHLFYCEVSNKQHLGAGGGNPDEGEFIEVVDLPVEEIDSVLFGEQHSCPSSLKFAFIWFQKNKQ